MAYVNIVTSDRGWILERLATEITKRLPYVRFSGAVDPAADIQYYITYSSWKKRISAIELACFTHLEEDKSARDPFFEAADSMDYCVCMADIYTNMLREAGVQNVTTISPGVDLDALKPVVKIGVVGRTYHTGRKGEAIVAQVMDIPGIEWHFTGEGWPGPALNLPDEGMSAFYNSMDYILVPAFYEGGPMSVVEALACGTAVIAPPIGWVSKFPHIEYKTGDVADLRRVLEGVVAERRALRESVSEITWDNWATGHDRLFRDLMARAGLNPETPVPYRLDDAPQADTSNLASRQVWSAALLTHGREQITLGGPSVRVPKTAELLRQHNINARALNFPVAELPDYDLIHGFNIWAPQSAVKLARRASALDKPLVFSPIILDLSEAPLWRDALVRVSRDMVSAEHMEELWAKARLETTIHQRSGWDPTPGYSSALREIADRASAFIFLSEREQSLCHELGAAPRSATIIRNPVDAALFSSGDPELFKSTYGLSDYVLCVGRIESRKNQLLLALALHGTNIPLVLIGHTSELDYLKKIKALGGANVTVIDRLHPGSPMLLSAIAGARVFTLPSWAEGAPLAALEAGAAGARMVLSDRSGEREYFGAFASYCDPSDPQSIHDIIVEAWETEWPEERRAALKAHVAENYGWDRYIAETALLYAEVFKEYPKKRGPHPRQEVVKKEDDESPIEIVMDVTSSVNYGDTRSGIGRVERAISLALNENPRAKVYFVMYHGPSRFVMLPSESLRVGILKGYSCAAPLQSPEVGTFKPDARFLILGSGWMQNTAYAESLGEFAADHKLVPSIFIHDLLPLKFPHWYLEGYAEVWNRNLAIVFRVARQLLAYSENTRRDIETTALTLDLDIGPIEMIRLADEIGSFTNRGQVGTPALLTYISGRPFILAVGAIHTRKNYGLLHDCWIALKKRMGDRCPNLVIVGGVSWNGKDIARALQEDPQVKGFIHILHDIDDDALEWLYRNCLMTLYPSLYEGWGLPVGESLSHGKICLASDTSSVPEIAPGLTDLLDPYDRNAWVARIQFYAGSESARRQREAEIREHYRTTSWAASAEEILRALTVVPNSRPSFYTLGQIVYFNRAEDAATFKRGGWSNTESWGIWSRDRSARLRFDLAVPPHEDLILSAVVRTLKFIDETRGFSVWVNGTKIADWSLAGGEEVGVIRTAFIPRRLIVDDGRVELELRSARLVDAASVNPQSGDQRALGIGLTALRIEGVSHPIETFHSSPGLCRALSGSQDQLPEFDPLPPLLRPGSWVSSDEGYFRAFFGQNAALDPAWGVTASDGNLRMQIGIAFLECRKDVRIKMMVRAVAKEEAPLTVSIFGNGRVIEQWSFISSLPVWKEFTLSGGDIGNQDPLEIIFISSEAVSPASLSLGTLEAPISFGVMAVNCSASTGAKTENAPPLPAGGPEVFNDAASSATAGYLAAGWYRPEGFGVWSIGSAGILRFTVEDRDAVLLVHASTLPETAARGSTEVYRGASLVGRIAFPPGDGAGPQAIGLIDLSGGAGLVPIELRFEVPSPQNWDESINAPGDHRLLGIALNAIELKSLPLFDPAAAKSLDLLWQQVWMAGWHEPEEGGRWTDSHRARIALRLPLEARGIRVMLRVSVIGATAEAPRRFTILANGRETDHWLMSSNEAEEKTVTLSCDSLYGNGLLDLTLMTDRLTTPTELGLSVDPRRLGIRLTGFEVILSTDQNPESFSGETGAQE